MFLLREVLAFVATSIEMARPVTFEIVIRSAVVAEETGKLYNKDLKRRLSSIKLVFQPPFQSLIGTIEKKSLTLLTLPRFLRQFCGTQRERQGLYHSECGFAFVQVPPNQTM